MKHAPTIEILDLCSGGTGSWIPLRKQFEPAGLDINVKLTDKYPNPESLQKWPKSIQKGIEYLNEPIDAMNVPFQLTGMRTLFAGFHHFKPEQAQQILRDAFEKKVPIGIFDPSSPRTPSGMILLLLLIPITPIIVLLSHLIMTPFMKPRTFSRNAPNQMRRGRPGSERHPRSRRDCGSGIPFLQSGDLFALTPHMEKYIPKDFPGAVFVGIRQGRSRRRLRNSEISEFTIECVQPVADLAERFALCELSEQHGGKLCPGRETLGIIFRTMLVNNSAKLSCFH